MSEVTRKIDGMDTPEQVNRPGWSRKRKLLTWGVVAGLVLATGGATAALVMSNYAAETQRLCTVAVTAYEDAVAGEVADAKTSAEKALESSRNAVIKKAVPGASAYSARAEVKANKKKKVEARPAAKTLIADVQDRAAAVDAVKSEAACDSREDAKTLTKETSALGVDAEALTVAVQALDADVKAFKSSEKKRIAAEKKAAAEKAAAEKAAAEAAAAQAAAEQAAAEQAAADTYYEPPTYSDNSGGGGGDTWNPPAPNPAPAPDPGNSGGGGGGGWAPPPPSGGGGDCPSTMNCHV